MFTDSTFLPVSKKEVSCKQITTSLEKDLAKTFLTKNVKQLFNFFNDLLVNLTGTNDFCFIDALTILLKARIISYGSIIPVTYKCKCSAECKHNINLGSIYSSFINLKFIHDFKYESSSFKVSLEIPSINILAESMLNKIDLNDPVLYIKKLCIETSDLGLEWCDLSQRKKIVDALPVSVVFPITEFIEKIKKVCRVIPVDYAKCECGNILTNEYFMYNAQSILNLLSIMFEESLHDIYRDIYALTSKLKFSPEYVETLTPAERIVYLQYFREEQKEEEKQNESR